mmetsp:Transcript_43489/g.84989  ORF Transcript_43489/g.84989 Transcript_43489/m.84989 type:complete len:245 (+) Transcript_43489:365-1099(+)
MSCRATTTSSSPPSRGPRPAKPSKKTSRTLNWSPRCRTTPSRGHAPPTCSRRTSRASATSVCRSRGASQAPARRSGAARGCLRGRCLSRRRRGRWSSRRCRCGPSTATSRRFGPRATSTVRCRRRMRRLSVSLVRWMPRQCRSNPSRMCSMQSSTSTSNPRSSGSWTRARTAWCHSSTASSRPKSTPRLPARCLRRCCTMQTSLCRGSSPLPRSFGACSASLRASCTSRRQTRATAWCCGSSAR